MGSQHPDNATAGDRKDRVILVVDEDPKSLLSLSTILVRLGYRVIQASTSRQAMTAAITLSPSLVIVSLYPAANSLKMLRHVKKRTDTAYLPVLCISGPGDALRDQFLEQGAAGQLDRPVEAGALYAAVQAALEKNPRSSPRIRTVLPVRVYGDTLYGAYTLMLSSGGMFLRTLKPVAVNSHLSLEFDVNGRQITADGVVLYSCQTGSPCGEPGIGLRFEKLAPGDQAVITEFISNELTKSIPLA